MLNWLFIVLVHWNNSLWLDMSLTCTHYPDSEPTFSLMLHGEATNTNFIVFEVFYVQRLFLYPRSPKGEGGILFYLCPSVRPSQDIFRRIFLSNCWWQKSDFWSQASYRYTILWVAFLDPSDSYFLFANFVDFYTHWTYIRIFLCNYWWQKSDIWSQASYRYPILWEAFLDPSDSYFLFADFVDFYTHLTYICICTFFVAFFSATQNNQVEQSMLNIVTGV